MSGPAADKYIREMVDDRVRPGTRMSTSRPSVGDRHPGLGAYKIDSAELSGVERQLIKGVEERTCAVEGCNARFSSATRRFCIQHGYNSGGKLGLKEE